MCASVRKKKQRGLKTATGGGERLKGKDTSLSVRDAATETTINLDIINTFRYVPEVSIENYGGRKHESVVASGECRFTFPPFADEPFRRYRRSIGVFIPSFRVVQFV